MQQHQFQELVISTNMQLVHQKSHRCSNIERDTSFRCCCTNSAGDIRTNNEMRCHYQQGAGQQPHNFLLTTSNATLNGSVQSGAQLPTETYRPSFFTARIAIQ
jgi:hypothetical protein